MRLRTIYTAILISISLNIFGQGNGLYKFLSKNGKYGFIDSKGKIKIVPKYLRVKDFSEGLSFVSEEINPKGYKWICIDVNGNKIFDTKNNFPETDFSEGFARISSLENHWFINKSGINEFGKTWMDGYQNFKDGIAYVSDIQFQNFYPIDNNGNRIGEKNYSSVEIYSLNKPQKTKKNKLDLIPYENNGLWGFKANDGKIVIEPKFYKVDVFENGICGVLLEKQPFEIANDYYLDAIIDEKGKILSKQGMHCFMGFREDLILYFLGPHFSGGPQYINKNGQKVTPRK